MNNMKIKEMVNLKKILLKDLKLIQNQLRNPNKYPSYINDTLEFSLVHLREDILEYEEEYTVGHWEAIEVEYNKVRELAKQKLNIDIGKLSGDD